MPQVDLKDFDKSDPLVFWFTRRSNNGYELSSGALETINLYYLKFLEKLDIQKIWKKIFQE